MLHHPEASRISQLLARPQPLIALVAATAILVACMWMRQGAFDLFDFSGARARFTPSRYASPGYVPIYEDVPKEQEGRLLVALEQFGNDVVRMSRPDARPTCRLRDVGTGWGKHVLPARSLLPKPCVFFSFGISSDYSFDTQLSNEDGCQGYSLDPTVTPGAKLAGNVVFLHAGATTLDDATNRMWLVTTSVPRLRAWLGHERVDIMKMDCEGCEFALPADIQAEDPGFFSRVDSFALEVHFTRFTMTTRQYALRLGQLYDLLQKAGMELQHVELTRCAGYKEDMGCREEILAAGFPCERGQMCQNYLFARPDPPVAARQSA